MAARHANGDWSFTEGDLRRLAVVVSLAGGVFTAGVSWMAASVKVDQMVSEVTVVQNRITALEKHVQDLSEMKEDIHALLRIGCVSSTEEHRRLAGIRCSEALRGRPAGSSP
jgi:hypothetical protein